MCTECHRYPCDPRCPQAPPPAPAFVCDWCGAPVFDEVYYAIGGQRVCAACIEDARRMV